MEGQGGSLEDAVRVVSLGLACGGAVKGPVREVLGLKGGDRLLDDLRLRAHLVEDCALQHALFGQDGCPF